MTAERLFLLERERFFANMYAEAFALLLASIRSLLVQPVEK